MEEEGRRIAGPERYQPRRRADMAGGKQKRSLYLLDHKLPILAPRARDQGERKKVRSKSDERLQEPCDKGERIMQILRAGGVWIKEAEISRTRPQTTYGLTADD